MKRRSNKRGFILVLLILFIAVIGVETIVLSEISCTMAFEANDAYLRACRENLIISGLAWAKTNADKGPINQTTELDIASLGLRRAELKVTVSAGQKEANILASCSVARQTLRTNDKYGF